MISQKNLLLFFLILISTLSNAQRGELRAGAAKVDISPLSSMLPIGGMQQYANIHDPIYARALVMDNGINKAALISLDLGSVPGGDDLVNSIITELKVKPEHIVLSAVHNHNAPSIGRSFQPGTPNPYYDLVKKGVIEAVRQANSKMKLAEIGYGTGKAYINTNRDEKIGNEYHMGYNPEGPSDKTVAVISVVDRQTYEPMAIYSNYAVHAVVMYRAKTKDGLPEITGDLPGATSNYVEAHFKNAIALWTSGPAGDQNPIFMANYNQDHPDVHDTGASGYAILDVLSRRLGEEIVRVAKSIQNRSKEVEIWGKQGFATCPGQRNSAAPAGGSVPGTTLKPSEVKMIDAEPVDIPISLFMINDLALVGISGELYTQIGTHLKSKSLFDRTLIVTHTPKGVGYIATDAAYLLPAEKTVGNRIKPGCAESAIVEGITVMMREYLNVQKAAKASVK